MQPRLRVSEDLSEELFFVIKNCKVVIVDYTNNKLTLSVLYWSMHYAPVYALEEIKISVITVLHVLIIR